MKVSRQWLQNFFDTPLPATSEIVDGLTFHAFEVEDVQQVGSDEIIDVKVLGDRGHDCLCHRGIAHELSAILKLPFNKQRDPFAKTPELSKVAAEVSVSIENATACPRYIAGLIKGVKVGPSPDWLKTSLEAIGQRSINNVVDATNLVMFNIGQPLHAFDVGRLGSTAIGVRFAHEGEELEALDAKKYALKASMLVITAADRPVSIAGIKGGMADRIDENTKDIVIESATFDGPTIRKAAKLLKLRTDASARFEQVLSPELAAYGMQQVVDLIAAVAGGEVAGFVDAYPTPLTKKSVSVSLTKINSVLGISLTSADVADVFTRLGFAYKEEGGVFEVFPPFERLDITISEDLVEEVGRIVGYDKIPATLLPESAGVPEVNENIAAAERVRADLMALGYSEVYTSVFADKGERAVLNKVDSVKPFMRTTLVDGLNEALKKNIPNKDLLGLKEIKLFEVGTVWKGGKELLMAGIVTEKEKAKEDPLEMYLKPGTGYPELPLSTATRYQTFSKYPYIVRDIALWVPTGTTPESIQATIQKEAGELAVRVNLFDQFEKQGRVSLAFRIVFQSFERTLTEDEANAAMEKVYAALKAQGFEIR